MIYKTKYLAISLALLISLYPTIASTDQEIEKSLLIDELIQEHGFDEQYVMNIFENTKFLPELIESISKPAERTKTWPEYRDIFITNKRIAAGVLFAKQNDDIINRAVAEMGIPRKILLGILGVETYFGRIQGGYKVMDSLYTLATGYPPRAKFFRSELINLFYLCREEDFSILDIKGSYAGAMGAAQDRQPLGGRARAAGIPRAPAERLCQPTHTHQRTDQVQSHGRPGPLDGAPTRLLPGAFAGARECERPVAPRQAARTWPHPAPTEQQRGQGLW